MENQQNDIQEILKVVRSLEKNSATKSEVQEILEIVQFIKNNVMTREETESRLTEVKSEIVTHVDAFAALHQKLEQELTALRGKYDRLESALTKIAQRLELSLSDLGL